MASLQMLVFRSATLGYFDLTGMLDQRHSGRGTDIDGRRRQLVHLQLSEPGDVRIAAGRMKA